LAHSVLADRRAPNISTHVRAYATHPGQRVSPIRHSAASILKPQRRQVRYDVVAPTLRVESIVMLGRPLAGAPARRADTVVVCTIRWLG
jgi:hypothetical protein